MLNQRERVGMFYGLCAVIAFSLTLPMTRYSVPYFGSVFVGMGRALLAAILAGVILLIKKEPLPTKKQIKSLFIVAFGVIFGFPIFSAWAMDHVPASHGAVVLALLPLATAGFAVVRAGERPSIKFWMASIIGCIAVMIYSVGLGLNPFQPGDLLLLGAVLTAAIGYAEGGQLAKEMAGWKVICWALILSVPFLVVPVVLEFSDRILQAPLLSWLGFVYLSLVSQLVGFFAWYSGLAMGGVARVSQLQYLQPFFTIAFSVFLLNENITLFTVVSAVIVVISVILGKNAIINIKQ